MTITYGTATGYSSSNHPETNKTRQQQSCSVPVRGFSISENQEHQCENAVDLDVINLVFREGAFRDKAVTKIISKSLEN